MAALRLGDDIDDFCVRCRRLTNHVVVSFLGGEPAKVRCRSCYSDHNYLREQAPPSKKELQRELLAREMLAEAAAPPDAEPAAEETAVSKRPARVKASPKAAKPRKK